MASLNSIPRFLLPRGLPAPRTSLLPLSIRHASSLPPRPGGSQPRKPAVIPQPDKYRPPSHGRRTPRSETDMRSYGPKLSEEDKKRMRTKKYPNMMSPEGTFMHWFLNNRAIHLYICFGTLLSLAVAAWYMDFRHKTIYADMLPTKKEFFRHPWESASRAISTYQLHVEHQSEVTAQRLLKKQDEVAKRKQFWLDRKKEAEESGDMYKEDPRYYIDEEGTRRRRVKRWLGIWE